MHTPAVVPPFSKSPVDRASTETATTGISPANWPKTEWQPRISEGGAFPFSETLADSMRHQQGALDNRQTATAHRHTRKNHHPSHLPIRKSSTTPTHGDGIGTSSPASRLHPLASTSTASHAHKKTGSQAPASATDPASVPDPTDSAAAPPPPPASADPTHPDGSDTMSLRGRTPPDHASNPLAPPGSGTPWPDQLRADRANTGDAEWDLLPEAEAMPSFFAENDSQRGITAAEGFSLTTDGIAIPDADPQIPDPESTAHFPNLVAMHTDDPATSFHTDGTTGFAASLLPNDGEGTMAPFPDLPPETDPNGENQQTPADPFPARSSLEPRDPTHPEHQAKADQSTAIPLHPMLAKALGDPKGLSLTPGGGQIGETPNNGMHGIHALDTLSGSETGVYPGINPAGNRSLTENTPPVLRMTADLRSGSWHQEMGERLLWIADRDLKSAYLELHPAEWGPLQIQLQLNPGEDAARVHFITAHPLAKQALEAHMDTLKEWMQSHGLRLQDSGVSDQGRQGEGFQQPGDHPNPPAAYARRSNAPEASVPQGSTKVANPWRSQSIRGVDYYV